VGIHSVALTPVADTELGNAHRSNPGVVQESSTWKSNVAVPQPPVGGAQVKRGRRFAGTRCVPVRVPFHGPSSAGVEGGGTAVVQSDGQPQ
jgi:hypothetical protein